VNRDDIGTRLRERRHKRVNWRDHQVNIEQEFRVGPQRCDDARPNCEIWHKVPVHYINMDEIGAGSFNGPNFFGKAREISGKDGRCDLNGLGHAPS
jgi:hypothetical protein